MKKCITILPLIACLFSSVCLSQAPDSIKNKKQKYCLAELTKMNGVSEIFILGGFSGDSMIGYSFFKDGDKVMIQQHHRVATKSADIRRVSIKIGKHNLVGSHPPINDTAGMKGQDTRFVALNLFVIPRQTWYAINGLERKFKKMANELTAKRQN